MGGNCPTCHRPRKRIASRIPTSEVPVCTWCYQKYRFAHEPGYREAYEAKHRTTQRDGGKPRRASLERRIAAGLRNRLALALHRESKAGSAVGDLGCTVAEFKTYLESKFQLGMTWKNWSRGGWHLDHIKPLSQFDLTDRQQFLQACHYSNLQPLWAVENLRKGAGLP